MWSLVIGTVLIFALGILVNSLILFMTDPSKVDHEWLSYSSCVWFTFSTFIGESVMRKVYRVHFSVKPLRPRFSFRFWVQGLRR